MNCVCNVSPLLTISLHRQGARSSTLANFSCFFLSEGVETLTLNTHEFFIEVCTRSDGSSDASVESPFFTLLKLSRKMYVCPINKCHCLLLTPGMGVRDSLHSDGGVLRMSVSCPDLTPYA